MAEHKIDGNDGAGNVDLIRRIDAMQACQVGPSDEWSRATKDGYNQAARDCAMAILRLAPVSAANDEMTIPESETDYCIGLRAQLAAANARAENYDLFVEALSEIKATVDGQSDQSVKSIIDAVLLTIHEDAAHQERHLAIRDKPAPAVTVQEAEDRTVLVAAGLFSGGFDSNVAAIRDALRAIAAIEA